MAASLRPARSAGRTQLTSVGSRREWDLRATWVRSSPNAIDPRLEALRDLVQEFGRRFVDQPAVLREQSGGVADIGFRLLHGRHVEEDERLPKVMIGAESADC